MAFEEIKEKLDTAKDFSIVEVLNLEYGKQIRLNNGCLVNCYNTGKTNYQGKNIDIVKAFLENKAEVNKKFLWFMDTMKLPERSLMRCLDVGI